MNKGGTVEAAGIRFTMVHADHTGGATLTTGSEQVTRDLGCWGWVIEFEDGTTVYHSGDTDLFGDMNLVRERFEPRSPSCRSAGTTRWDPADAGRALEMIGAAYVIPVHYGTFPILAGTPDELAEHTRTRGRRARARRDLGGRDPRRRPRGPTRSRCGRRAAGRRRARTRPRRGSRRSRARGPPRGRPSGQRSIRTSISGSTATMSAAAGATTRARSRPGIGRSPRRTDRRPRHGAHPELVAEQRDCHDEASVGSRTRPPPAPKGRGWRWAGSKRIGVPPFRCSAMAPAPRSAASSRGSWTSSTRPRPRPR